MILASRLPLSESDGAGSDAASCFRSVYCCQLVRAGVSYDKWNKADYEILARSMLKVVLKQEDGSVLRERQEGHCLLFVLKARQPIFT